MNDKSNINKKQDNDDRGSYVGFGIAFGLIGGFIFSTIVGMFFKFPLIWAFGPGFGMLIGIVIGSIIDLNKNPIEKIKIIKILSITVIGVILISLVPKIISYL